MWQFYVGLVGALAGAWYTAMCYERYAIVVNYATTCHLQLDPVIREQSSDLENKMRRSEYEGFFEEQIAQAKKKRRQKTGRSV